MGSFLNQGSHDKSSLKEGASCVLVVSAQEMRYSGDKVTFGKFTPLLKILAISEDYGEIYEQKNGNKLLDFVMYNQKRFMDGKFSRYGFSNEEDLDSSLKSYDSRKDLDRGEASIFEYAQIFNKKPQDVRTESMISKIRNGLVFSGENQDHFYQIKLSLFKKSTYDKAKGLALLDEHDKEVSLEEFKSAEIEKLFEQATEKHEKFSAEWFNHIEVQIQHPLYVNLEKDLDYPHDEVKLKKSLIKYYDEFLELKYLTQLGLEFSPLRYAGQDYGNDLGKYMKEIKKKVSL